MQTKRAPGLTASQKTDASQKTTGAAFSLCTDTSSSVNTTKPSLSPPAGGQLLRPKLDARGSGVLAVGYWS